MMVPGACLNMFLQPMAPTTLRADVAHHVCHDQQVVVDLFGCLLLLRSVFFRDELSDHLLTKALDDG